MQNLLALPVLVTWFFLIKLILEYHGLGSY
jgi:hypothetical protein